MDLLNKSIENGENSEPRKQLKLMNLLKGGYRNLLLFFHLVLLGMIYGGNIVKMAHSYIQIKLN